jgi:preprotein translocase subunit SecF
MFVITYKNFFFILSGLLVAVSIAAMIIFGFNFGIDFKGGTLTQVSYQAAGTVASSTSSLVLANPKLSQTAPISKGRPSITVLQTTLAALKLPNFSDTTIQPSGTTDYIIRSRQLSNTEKPEFLAALSLGSTSPYVLESYDSVGPVIGAELEQKSIVAIAVVIACIVLFVTFAFRKVSEPVPSWKYGLATIVALAHDVIIPTGFFIMYLHYTGGQLDILFVSAALTILGYSVHDTIVVFDRIREHLRINQEQRAKEPFSITVGKSVSETFGRSINTSLTIFLVLLILFLAGGPTTTGFSLMLLFGIIVGTYSSIFVASPLLVVFEKWQKKAE